MKSFIQFNIDIPNNINLFNELSNSIYFEEITNGRKGAVLVDNKNNLIPIVRTTTKYNKPAQNFLPIHYNIIEEIKKKTNNNINFNNALIEIYDSNYCKMGYHSDQALDLVNNSYIGIFSCYDKSTDIRTLKVKEKLTNILSEYKFENNSVILFSTTINYKYLHKIILEKNISNNKWLGITFRLSKTFIKFINEIPYFIFNNKQLTIANENEKKEFYKYRRLENKNIDYIYPEINYTISISDILPQFK